MKRFVKARLICDDGPRAMEYQELQEQRFNDVLLPLYAIVRVKGKAPQEWEELARTGGRLSGQSALEFLRGVQ